VRAAVPEEFPDFDQGGVVERARIFQHTVIAFGVGGQRGQAQQENGKETLEHESSGVGGEWLRIAKGVTAGKRQAVRVLSCQENNGRAGAALT